MEETNQKSWFGRNWPWVLPVGGCLTLIVLAVMGIGTLFVGVSKMFTSSAPYEYALSEASNNAEVIAVLGEPIESDGIISGNISLKNNDGEADFSIPIKGLNGEGSITVVGTKIGGEWTYKLLYVTIKETQEQINLLK
ncbi:cytochrome c oxidase assembly factor Coa1 family protein [Seonamhaeicola maritimus]|uniref:cytochrome c oxidase assembly factor Coa1 family protein n=1 Tax=Seonamhaeicola maritimus TaxID=2591822 RepID=UPI002494733A|nr:cytochrome c oxidase assembly factor Coa1 family protein [Seonamhaeicola maritimus]